MITWFQPVQDAQKVDKDLTLRDALQLLNDTGKGILLVLDPAGKLTRTVTDGDLRRLMLKGGTLDDRLSKLPKQEPVTCLAGDTRERVLSLMNEFGVSQMPVLDEQNLPRGVAYRNEVDSAILLSTPHLGEQEKEFVEQAFTTNWIAPVGPNIDSFENELSEIVNIENAVAVSSGTAALHLALHVLGVQAGDTVFCSSFTFVASVNPIYYCSATPIFIDSDPETWNMSPIALERALYEAAAIGKLPKAVIVVDLYGQSANYEKIGKLCRSYGVPIVEDAAEALGATYKNKHCGTFGDIGFFSFNGNKIITTSGGGMLVTKHDDLARRAKFLSTQAREPKPWYEHKAIGFNYRMSNILAGVGRGQLQVLSERVAARRSVFERYKEMFAGIDEIEWMPEARDCFSTRWLSAALIKSEHIAIDELIAALSKRRIECRRVWKPMHLQPVFTGVPYYPHREEESICESIFEKGICLPSSSNLSQSQQAFVVESILDILGRKQRC